MSLHFEDGPPTIEGRKIPPTLVKLQLKPELLNGPKASRLDVAVRLTEFWRKLPDGAIAIIVSNPERTRSNDTEYAYRQSSDMLYLSGFPEPESVLIINKIDGKQELIMLVRPKDRQSEIWTGIRYGVEGAKKEWGADKAYPVQQFAEVIGPLLRAAKSVYYRFGINEEFDQKFRKVWEPEQKPLFNPNTILHEMRLFKTAKELELMRHAAAITAAAHSFGMQNTRPGMSEGQLQALIEMAFRFYGGSGLAYGSIVAGGNNAVVLHYTENKESLQDGDLILIDAAAEYGWLTGGYAADITRCWPVNGKFSEAQAEIYQVVLDAQVAAIKACKPGVALAHIHQVASRVMRRGLKRLGILPSTSSAKSDRKKGKKTELTLGDFFMHGTSHWLGIDVHDVGSYATASGTRTDKGRGKRRVLEPGMAFTVEPGLYFDKNDKRVPKKYRGIGVRIEDDIVITETGCEILTAGVPKTIADIEQLMAGR